MSALLEIAGLRVEFAGRGGVTVAVEQLDLSVGAGQTVGLVGESGCGKSISALSVMGLVPPAGRVTAGSIRFDGRELLGLSAEERRKLRGGAIGLIPQDPLAALNPVYPIGAQVAEAVRLHRGLDDRAAWEAAVEALGHVGIPSPAQRARDWPHQLSGGQRQRVMIAMAVACGPKLLIADEPTTALDVSVQAQILDLLRRLQAESNMALLLITHDLGVVAQMADRVTVMRDGRVVEERDVRGLFAAPENVYTQTLLRAVPRLDAPHEQPVAEAADA